MATAERKANYAGKYAKVIAKLTEKGRVVSFGNRANGLDNWNPSDDYVERGKASVFPLEWDKYFSDDVQADDLMFITSAETDLKKCRVMIEPAGQGYNIVKVKPFMPDDQVIFYEIQVRGNG